MKQREMQMKMQKVSAAIQQNKYMTAISGGLMSLMAVMIIGAVFTLIDSVPIPAYQYFLESTGLNALTSLPLEITTNMISIYVVFAVAHKLAGEFEVDGFSAGMIALVSFLTLTPLAVLEDGVTNAISFQWIGSAGLFVAMIVGLVSARLYVLILKKGLYIKMPKGVPPTIEKSFASLTPGFIIVTLMLVVRGIFAATSFGSIHAFIFGTIQTPLTHLGSSIPALIFMMVLIHVLWFFGIHGAMLVLSIMQAPLMPLGIENLNAFQAGEPLPNLLILQSVIAFGMIGGSGSTIGLVIAMLRAKSKRYKTLGRLSIVPGICAINEPILFGMPLVLNTRFVIPLIVTPTLLTALGIALTVLGILPPLNGVGAPLGTPVVVQGFIQGGWQLAVFQVVAIPISYFMYLPFFKKADAEAFAMEEEGEKMAGKASAA